MRDSYGREIDYIRISITDRCNLRCKYCMPDGITCVSMADILTLEEICQVAASAAELGIRHVKVTGGEPLVRKGCCDLVRMLKAVPGIEKVTITTNGILLGQYLEELTAAGIDGINISLDTRNRQIFEKITGRDCLAAVLGSIERASKLPVPVKVNAVSLNMEELFPGLGEKGRENWADLAEIARELPVDVRFIEMMPIGRGKEFPAIDPHRLLETLKACYPGVEEDRRFHGFGPAVYYRIPGFRGSIGFISAIHGKFCDGCNRVRLTSQGYLKTCLCYEEGADLRAILRSGLPEPEQTRRLKETMEQSIWNKPAAHCFEKPERITESQHMSAIGG